MSHRFVCHMKIVLLWMDWTVAVAVDSALLLLFVDKINKFVQFILKIRCHKLCEKKNRKNRNKKCSHKNVHWNIISFTQFHSHDEKLKHKRKYCQFFSLQSLWLYKIIIVRVSSLFFLVPFSFLFGNCKILFNRIWSSKTLFKYPNSMEIKHTRFRHTNREREKNTHKNVAFARMQNRGYSTNSHDEQGSANRIV